jgi:hypothetical protein
MKFIKKYRKLLILIIIAALLVSYSIVIVNRPYGNFTGSFYTQEFLRHEPIFLKVGETYDMTDLLAEAEAGLDLKERMQVEGGFQLTATKGTIEQKGTKIRAISSGIGHAFYNYNYLAYWLKVNKKLYSETAQKDLLQADFIILSEVSDYVEVYSLDDLTAENKTFILKNDIVVTEAYNRNYLLYIFNGVLINPDGYTITIEESSGLSAICNYNLGVFDGIILSAELGFCDYSLTSVCGLTIYNEGFITDCDLEAEFETTGGKVRLDNIYDSTLNCNITIIETETNTRCTFTYRNLKNTDIQFNYRGYTEGLAEEELYLPENSSYTQIIIPPEE